jgi:hypothetical protein
VKQSLYFDRYLKILAPGLDVGTQMALGSGSRSDDGIKTAEVIR